MSDTRIAASAFAACSVVRACLTPTFDDQRTSAGLSLAANLVKQRLPYVSKPPVFSGTVHSFYGPLPGLVTAFDTWIDAVSWQEPGGLDEVMEIQNAAGQTLFRGVAHELDDSNFACVRVGRMAKGGYKVPVLDSGRVDVHVGRQPGTGRSGG